MLGIHISITMTLQQISDRNVQVLETASLKKRRCAWTQHSLGLDPPYTLLRQQKERLGPQIALQNCVTLHFTRLGPAQHWVRGLV